MARKPKSVYERIEMKVQEIKRTEENLRQLTEELQQLESEKEQQEMCQLFNCMKSKGLNIEQALAKLNK